MPDPLQPVPPASSVPPARPAPSPKPEAELDDKTKAANDAYAQALLSVTMAEYEKQHPKESQKRLITNKRMMILIISTVVGIILTVVAGALLKSKTGNNSDQGQQLLHSVKTFDNPNSY